MKAFILCAGLGTRLRALGLDVPKVMVPIGGKPLLERHFELFKSQGITEIGVNLHYKPETIRGYFGDGAKFGVRIAYSDEPELLGTAGGVRKMRSWIGRDRCLVYYGDNLVKMDFSPMIRLHEAKKAGITLMVHESSQPWTGGVVEVAPDGRVTKLVEKPPKEECKSNLISAGIFVIEPQVLDEIPEGQFFDFGRDVFPLAIAKKIPFYAIKADGYIQDVGTPERYEKAERDFKAGLDHAPRLAS